MKPSEKQIGGSHYKDFAMQPAEFIHMNQIGFLEGNVIKYVCRHAAKNGRDDLLKARHYIDLLLEWQYGEIAKVQNVDTPAPTPVDCYEKEFLPDHSPRPEPGDGRPVPGELRAIATCPCGRLICKVCKWP